MKHGKTPKRGIATRLAATGAVTALALGVAACETENDGEVEDGIEDTTEDLGDTTEDTTDELDE